MRSALIGLCAFVLGCGARQEDPDPCEGVDCGGLGTCEVGPSGPSCACVDGTVARGLSCVDPCGGVDCGGLGTCAVVDGAPTCVCEPSAILDGLTCIARCGVELGEAIKIVADLDATLAPAAAFSDGAIVVAYVQSAETPVPWIVPVDVAGEPLADPTRILDTPGEAVDVAVRDGHVLVGIPHGEDVAIHAVSFGDETSSDEPTRLPVLPGDTDGLPDVLATTEGLAIGYASVGEDGWTIHGRPLRDDGTLGFGGNFDRPSAARAFDVAAVDPPVEGLGALAAWVDDGGELVLASLTTSMGVVGERSLLREAAGVNGIAVAAGAAGALVAFGTVTDGVWAIPLSWPDLAAGEPVAITTEDRFVVRDSLAASPEDFLLATTTQPSVDDEGDFVPARAYVQRLAPDGRATSDGAVVDIGIDALAVSLWLGDGYGIVATTPLDPDNLLEDPDLELRHVSCP